MECKEKICSLLLKTLQATRKYSDLVSLEYTGADGAEEEYVCAKYSHGGWVKINVTGDSGIALIADVLGGLA